MKPLCVMLLTYDRFDYAERTLEALRENLQSPVPVHIHIADDGDPPDYRGNLVGVAAALFGSEAVSITNSERRGYGASYNLATMAAHTISDILLPLEDDWVLTRPLDIAPMIETLGDGDIRCIRMGYIGYTQTLRGEFAYRHGNHYLLFDSASEEPHVFAGGPRLETKEFEVAVGLWPEMMADRKSTRLNSSHSQI